MKYSFRRSRFAGCGRIGGKARSLLIHNRSECVLVRLLAVSALVSAAFVQTPAQISSPVGFTTFQTNQLASPTAPTATAGPGCTSGATNYSWTYEVVAIDATGGVTMPSGPSTAVLNKCSTSSSLSNVAYLIVATNPVVGAVSCGIYRISPTPAKIAYNIPCGSVYYDIGTKIDTTSPPTGNTTGGMRATGTIAAQAFNATGNGAGTEILTAGTPSLMTAT